MKSHRCMTDQKECGMTDKEGQPMTNDKFEKAQELQAKIQGREQSVKMLDTMLNAWYDHDRTDITVNYKGGQHDVGLRMHHTELPELRDALIAARDRNKHELRKLRDQFAEL